MKIAEKDIIHIEKALGVKLYEHQVNYLLDEGELDEKGLPKEMQGGSEVDASTSHALLLRNNIDNGPIDEMG